MLDRPKFPNYPELIKRVSEKYLDSPQKAGSVLSKLDIRERREKNRQEIQSNFRDLKSKIESNLPELIKIYYHYQKIGSIFTNFENKEKDSSFIDFSDLSKEEIETIGKKASIVQKDLGLLIVSWQEILVMDEKEAAPKNGVKLLNMIHEPPYEKLEKYSFRDLINTLDTIHYDKEGNPIKENSENFVQIKNSFAEEVDQANCLVNEVRESLGKLVVSIMMQGIISKRYKDSKLSDHQ